MNKTLEIVLPVQFASAIIKFRLADRFKQIKEQIALAYQFTKKVSQIKNVSITNISQPVNQISTWNRVAQAMEERERMLRQEAEAELRYAKELAKQRDWSSVAEANAARERMERQQKEQLWKYQ
jgi:hypothetical protein